MKLRGIRSDRLRDLARDAMAQGFRIEQTGGGHPVLVSPTGERVWFSTTANDGYHIAANVRSSLMRAGYVPRDRRGSSRAVLAPPPPIVRLADDEPSREVEMGTPYVAERPKVAEGGGYTYVSKGKSIDAEDVVVGGQPFRIRTNADGSLNSTTLRRTPQRSWQSKVGDRDRLIRSMRAFAESVEPWEDPMPDTPYTNGRELGQPVGLVLEREAEWPGLDEHLEPEPDMAEYLSRGPIGRAFDDVEVEEALTVEQHGVLVAAFVDPTDYPIARALDELERAVEPAILALEAAGKSDAAALIRSELAKTPAELELLALYREVQMRPRLDRG